MTRWARQPGEVLALKQLDPGARPTVVGLEPTLQHEARARARRAADLGRRRRQRPSTHQALDEGVGVRGEPSRALERAEVVDPVLVTQHAGAVLGVDGHPTHRIDR